MQLAGIATKARGPRIFMASLRARLPPQPAHALCPYRNSVLVKSLALVTIFSGMMLTPHVYELYPVLGITPGHFQ